MNAPTYSVTDLILAAFDLSKQYVELRMAAVALKDLNSEETAALTTDRHSRWRPSILLQCLEAAKKFFQTFTSLPISEYRNMTFMDWTRLCQAFKIMSKLCCPIPSTPEWDLARARKEAQLGFIIESLCYRMQKLTGTGKANRNEDEWRVFNKDVNTVSPPDYFFMLHYGLQILKEVYDESTNVAVQEKKENQEVQCSTKCPILNGTIMDSDYGNALRDNYMFSLDIDELFGGDTGDISLNTLQAWDLEGT
jgi:hypothetical protein